MSCNSNDTVPHLHPNHFIWIFQQLQPSHLGFCQQCRKGNRLWLCPSSSPRLLESNSTTVFSCLIPFSIRYLICDVASPLTFCSRCNDILLTPSIIHCFPEPPCTPEALACLPSPFPYLASCLTISNKCVGFRTSYCEYQFGGRWEVCSAARQLETNLKMQPEGAIALSSPTPAAGQSADCQERQENKCETRGEANEHSLTVMCDHATQKWWIPTFLWK